MSNPGTIVYDSSSHTPSTIAARPELGLGWQGTYGRRTGPINIVEGGWDNSTVERLVELIEKQTHVITSVLVNQKEPVEILQVINLVSGLSRALRIVVKEREDMSSKIDSLCQQIAAIQQAAGQDHQPKSDIKF